MNQFQSNYNKSNAQYLVFSEAAWYHGSTKKQPLDVPQAEMFMDMVMFLKDFRLTDFLPRSEV